MSSGGGGWRQQGRKGRGGGLYKIGWVRNPLPTMILFSLNFFDNASGTFISFQLLSYVTTFRAL